MSGIFTQNIKNKFIEEMKTDVASNTSFYYVTFGKFTEWPDDNNPPASNSSIKEAHYEVNRNILFGKRVNENNIAYIASKKTWTANTVYDYYSDRDPDLYSKNYYVINSLNRVYKCLFNNYGGQSTIEPNLTVNNGDFNTADGYKWKYLFTVSSADRRLFSTENYFPITPNDSVTLFAEPGALHVIVVENSGNNYISANGYIESSISNTQFKISNTNASTISGAYIGSSFYIYSGGGTGQIAPITNYVVNSSGKFVTTNNVIRNINSTSLYRIEPRVYITGDGFNAEAISSVDTTTGKITSIEVINRGFDYSYADVSIHANVEFGSGATAFSIISPKGGHGSDVVTELGCDTMGISVSTNLTDSFPDWARYRQIALVYNPKATANNENFRGQTFNQMLNFNILSAPNLLDEGEIIEGFNSKAQATVAYMNTTHLYVINDTGEFQPFESVTSLTSGKVIIISTINNKDLVPYSSEVFYYKNIEPIERQGVASEDVKLYFNF